MGNGTDIGILMTIIMVMLMVGGFLPFIEGLFDEQSTTSDGTPVQDAVGQDVTVLNIVTSIAGLFFWDFGIRFLDDFFPLAIIITALKIIFYVILFKVIRGS